MVTTFLLPFVLQSTRSTDDRVVLSSLLLNFDLSATILGLQLYKHMKLVSQAVPKERVAVAFPSCRYNVVYL